MIRHFRYVAYDAIAAYERLGWYVCATHAPHHARYGVIMCWPCACALVEPADDADVFVELIDPELLVDC